MKQDQQIAVNTDRIEWLEKHYSKFNEEMGELRDHVASIKTDVNWIKKFLWWVVGIMISGFAGLFGLLIQHIMSK